MKRTCTKPGCDRRPLASSVVGFCLGHEVNENMPTTPRPPMAAAVVIPVRGVTCLCGCGKPTKGFLYAKGHAPSRRRDARVGGAR
jgi:hypothetical protein